MTSPTHAVRAFGFLTRGVGANRWSAKHRTSIDHNIAVVDRHGKAVHAAWCRTTLLLTDTVELRTMAGAFEPL